MHINYVVALQGEMGKSGERGHEGEPGIKVLIMVTLLILFLCDSGVQSKIYSYPYTH